MFFEIPRCYDSHLHLLATGQIQETLDLSFMKSETDIRLLKPTANHFCGEWLLGFGWDQNRWESGAFPSKNILDQHFPNTPVAFSRADGHALWVNTLALEKTGLSGSGILIDHEMDPLNKVIPTFSKQQKKNFLMSGMKKMNQAGFTHIRDMSGDPEQWGILSELDRDGLLTLYIEQNFYLDSISKLSVVLDFAIQAKKNQTSHLRVGAVKYFYDGALGSEGALLSHNYSGKLHQGLRLSHDEEIFEIIWKTWEKNLPVAIHTIGDQASFEVANIAWKVWQSGIHGQLHIEHGELIRPETIQILKKMNSIVHMQPCHWLSDHNWLESKVGNLIHFAFPWRCLADQQIPIYWGSDTPIEAPSVFNNLKALSESAAQGIPAYPFNPLQAHTYPDASWGHECRTEFSEDQILAVYFDGQKLPL